MQTESGDKRVNFTGGSNEKTAYVYVSAQMNIENRIRECVHCTPRACCVPHARNKFIMFGYI